MPEPKLVKEKAKNENTSYSQIITTCRMRYAVNQLLMDGKNISQVSQLCGYNSTSYFISVFKEFYGMTLYIMLANIGNHQPPNFYTLNDKTR